MEWKPEYAIGIARIDAQHRRIFEHLLAVEHSKESRDPRDIQRYFLSQLSDVLIRHFEIEETLLEAVRYPDLARHAAGHARLTEHLHELEQRVLAAPTAADLVHFFEDWFIRHVLADDRDYARYIAGLAAPH